jgi:hypothetical protein
LGSGDIAPRILTLDGGEWSACIIVTIFVALYGYGLVLTVVKVQIVDVRERSADDKSGTDER